MNENRTSPHLAAAQRYHVAIGQLLFDEWDPIGINDIPSARDEYDMYVSEIHAMLIRREPRHKLVDYLWWAETVHMALDGNRSRTEAIADRLIQLRDNVE